MRFQPCRHCSGVPNVARGRAEYLDARINIALSKSEVAPQLPISMVVLQSCCRALCLEPLVPLVYHRLILVEKLRRSSMGSQHFGLARRHATP